MPENAPAPRAPTQFLEEARFRPSAFEMARPRRSGTPSPPAAPSSRLGRVTAKLRRPEAQWQHQAMQRVANNKDKRQARRLWVACSEWLHAPTVPENAPDPQAPKPAREGARFGPRAFGKTQPSRTGKLPRAFAPSSRPDRRRVTVKLRCNGLTAQPALKAM